MGGHSKGERSESGVPCHRAEGFGRSPEKNSEKTAETAISALPNSLRKSVDRYSGERLASGWDAGGYPSDFTRCRWASL